MEPATVKTEQKQRNKRGDKRGMNPKSRANLLPPITSGDPRINPNGRPKGISITAEMNKLLAGDPEVLKTRKPKRGVELLARGIFSRATGKSDKLALETWNRVDGKLAEKTELSGPDGGPVQVSLLTPEQQRKRARAILEAAVKEADGNDNH